MLDTLSTQSIIILAVSVVTIVMYWETIFGRRKRAIDVPVPPECDRGWTPATRLTTPTLRNDNPKLINCYDPCTGGLLGSGVSKVMSREEVVTAVQHARAAQQQWMTTSFHQRRLVLKALLDYVVANQEVICRVAARDTGKTMVDGSFGEVLTTCEKLAWTIENGERVLQPEYRAVGMIMMHKLARVEYQPLGVLGAIIPWNYSFHNMLGPIISALFSGNAIVIKVSEHACWSSEFYGKIVKEILKSLGHSPDLVQIVTGFGETGSALTTSGVDKLTFIGSPEVGKLVMRDASSTLTPVLLELGGKDAAVVCEDCDYNQVVQLALRGTFQNCGQNCIGLERVVGLKGVYDRLVADMSKHVTSLTQGPPLEGDFDCGAMTMGTTQIEGIQKLVDDAVAKGARLIAGGCMNTKYGSRAFFQPTLLVDVTTDMLIAKKEVFGPVMVIMRAEDDNDAIRIVNSSEYGLGSSVFSLNKSRAEAIACRIHAGMCNMNDFGVNYLCQALPFGGVKISGFDRFAGVEGLRGCCNVRSVTLDRFPGIRTTIPPPLQYPVKASGFEFSKGLITMFYGNGLLQRFDGLITLIKASLQKK